jgi:hypothetical protein
MLRVEARLKSIPASPISFSKALQTLKETGEGHDDYDNRVWRERMHIDEQGEVFIPPMAFKLCLEDCARFLSESVPGKGKATFTKHFEAGVMCMEPGNLGVKAKDVICERLYVPSDGKKGGSKRVWRNFPRINQWETTAVFYVFDPILIAKPDKIHEYLVHAGKFIGLGRFRPRRGGWYGRFTVESFETSEE